MLTMTGGYYIAYLIIFGYANGTDSIIDISPYLIDSQNYDEDLNLIKEIHANITIDNNIFGYIKEDKIKIVSIPEQIKFSIGKDENKVEIENGEIIDVNVEYSLNQINSLIKTDEYYDLYYQGIIKELEYDDFYSQAHHLETHAENANDFNDYESKFFLILFNQIAFHKIT